MGKAKEANTLAELRELMKYPGGSVQERKIRLERGPDYETSVADEPCVMGSLENTVISECDKETRKLSPREKAKKIAMASYISQLGKVGAKELFDVTDSAKSDLPDDEKGNVQGLIKYFSGDVSNVTDSAKSDLPDDEKGNVQGLTRFHRDYNSHGFKTYEEQCTKLTDSQVELMAESEEQS
jgi:hypothetical protein